MATQRRRRFGRNAAVVATVLALHLALFSAAGRETFRPYLLGRGATLDAALPISITPYPRLTPAKTRLPEGRTPREAPAPSAPTPAVASPLTEPPPVAAVIPTVTPPEPSPEPSPQPPAADTAAVEPPQPSYPINPGYWEVEERWLVLSKTERYCVDPLNIVRFMAAPCNHIYHCDYQKQEVSDHRVSFAGVITGKDTRFNVSGSGVYTSTDFSVGVGGSGHYKILPMVLTASIKGRFLGAECPVDAKRIHQR